MTFKYKDYKIERGDALNINLYQYGIVNKKKGIKGWVCLGHHPDFFAALSVIAKRECEVAKDLDDLKRIIKELRKTFNFNNAERDKYETI